jgi:hypothetical protein
MKLRTRAAVALTVALLAAASLAVLAPAGPAVAFSSGGLFLDVQAEAPAHLVAGGASVDVPLEITCGGVRGTVDVYVTVTQRVGKGIASGFGYEDFGCSGGGQDVTVRVRADSAGKAFMRGNAVVDAEVFGCGTRVCGSETDSETVRLRR